MSEARAAQRLPVEETRDEDPSLTGSARFRIKIDPLGRILPEIVPVDDESEDDR